MLCCEINKVFFEKSQNIVFQKYCTVYKHPNISQNAVFNKIFVIKVHNIILQKGENLIDLG